MNSINISNLKAKKAKAIKKHRQLRKIVYLLRLIELCAVFVLISRFFVDVQVVVDYFKDFRVYFSSPKFVFVIGNVIVIALFTMSGQFSSHDYDSNGRRSRTDFYQEFIENSQRNHARPSGSHRVADISCATETAYDNLESKRYEIHSAGDISCQTLESKRYENSCVGNFSCAAVAAGNTLESKKYEDHCAGDSSCTVETVGDTLDSKKYQRSQSEVVKITPKHEKANKQLRRSVTDESEKKRDPGDGSIRSSSRKDNMSCEEFRSTIEAFIARQKRLRMDEEFSII